MRIITALAIAAALGAAPAVAQETNNAATTAPPADNMAAEPVTDANMTGNVVLPPGEATAVAPVEPMEPVAPAADEDDDDMGIPWGLLGLIGLIGLLGRGRRRD